MAKAAGAVVSFDLNFREKLWKISGGLDRAQQTLRRIMDHVDVVVGNEEDLQKGLGIAGPEVASKSKLDPTTFFGMIDRVVQQHPQVKIVATTRARSRRAGGCRRLGGWEDAHRGDVRSRRA
jgi:2-dehydro-3-deoxygluconokinase